MKKCLLWIWQFPQHLLALLLKRLFMGKMKRDESYMGKTVFFIGGIDYFGLSLGNYIFLSENKSQENVKHEYGHSRQSEKWGPLYLLAIGIPSVTMNIISRMFRGSRFAKNYYNRWPENEADELGGVSRKPSE